MNSTAAINLKIHIKSKNNTKTTKIKYIHAYTIFIKMIKIKTVMITNHYRNCIDQSNLIGIELSSA